MSIIKNKKILISGGGIGGLALAYWLKKYGFSPVVVESAPEFKHIGYLLGLNLQIGQVVAEKMGILEKLKTFDVPLTNNVMYDMDERLIMNVHATPKQHAENTGLMLNRADLHGTLYDLVKDNFEFRMGQEVASITQDENAAQITFTNNKTETFDLVIGSDGVHSKTRELVFGKGFEKNIGTAYFAFIIPNRTGASVAGEHELIMIRGKEFILAYHAIGQKEIGGYVFHRAEPFVALDPKDRRAFMIEQYGKYNKKFLSILESMIDSDHVFHDAFTQVIMPSWHKDRVCLIGDAAYCPTPASSMGASMAMASGYILAKNLSEAQDYKKAFTDHEAYVKPYILKTQKSAITASNFLAGKTIIPYGIVNALLKIFPIALITRVHTHKFEMPLP